jgi:CheY-like chemotaxis protein
LVGSQRKNAMLQNLSEQIRGCYQKAEQCAREAKSVRDEALRAFYVRREQVWLKLARSFEVEERLALFVDENRRQRAGTEDRRTGKIGGLKFPEPIEPNNDPKRLYDKMIAIVDDDEYARLGLAAFIESLGYNAATFASAEEYLASDLSIDNTVCLILDVHLPGMSGPCLQAQLIADARCPPTVFVTGRFEEHVQKQVIAAGALGYLTKPCNEKTLQHCIGVLCATA